MMNGLFGRGLGLATIGTAGLFGRGLDAAAAVPDAVVAVVPMPLRAIDIMDRPTCDDGVILVRATDCLRRTAEYTVTGEDRLTVAVPVTSAAVPYLTSRYVVRLQFGNDPDGFHEFRFLDDDTVVTRGGGQVVATAYDLVNDLAAPGPIRSLDPDSGVASFTFSVEATPAELITTYILPRLTARGYDWIALGTVEPTLKQLWEWSNLNPLELLRLIAASTSCEYRLRRNGTTNYLIDVVDQINSSEPAVDVRPGVNLTQFRRQRKGANHWTALEGFGLTQGDGLRATIARACWAVAAVDTVNDRLTLEDPLGVGAGPLVEDDQYVATAVLPAHYLFRYHQGGYHEIVDSFVETQEVELGTGEALSYAVGDLVEIRAGAAATGFAAEVPDGWGTNLWAGKRVTTVDSGNDRLTVDDPFADEDPVAFDDRYRGWTVRPYFLAASSAASGSSAVGDDRQVTVGSTTGMQAGDLVYHTSANPSGAPNWGNPTAAYEVVSVDSGTLVTITHRRKAGAVPAISTGFLSAWRARSDRVCTACSASGNTLDLDDVTSIVTDDVIECVRQYDGPVTTEIASPAGVAAHGIRVGFFERETWGERNLLLNGHFRDFTGGAHASPDHWYGTGKAFNVQNTDAAYLHTGITSVRMVALAAGTLTETISAGATEVDLQGTTGGRIEVGESIRLSVGLGNEETVVVTSVNHPGGTAVTIGFAACANAHTSGDSFLSVGLPAIPTPVWSGVFGGGIITGNAVLVAAPIDVPTVGTLTTYTVVALVYPKGFAAGDDVKVKIEASEHEELGGTLQTQELVLDVGTDIEADTWNIVPIPVAQPIAGGRLNVGVASDLTAGNTYPSDKQLYVGAVGLMQTNYTPALIPEFSHATLLHQAANAKLALVSHMAPANYELGLVDLYGLDPTTWPHLALIPGVTARTTELTAGVAQASLRILKLTVDYDRPAAVVAEVGSRQQRLTEILAGATVRVPIVRILADGTTEVLTATSRQALSFPSSTGVTAVDNFELVTEAG